MQGYVKKITFLKKSEAKSWVATEDKLIRVQQCVHYYLTLGQQESVIEIFS
jgi:hypothetical protein